MSGDGVGQVTEQCSLVHVVDDLAYVFPVLPAQTIKPSIIDHQLHLVAIEEIHASQANVGITNCKAMTRERLQAMRVNR